jgi:hypothetical protein
VVLGSDLRRKLTEVFFSKDTKLYGCVLIAGIVEQNIYITIKLKL